MAKYCMYVGGLDGRCTICGKPPYVLASVTVNTEGYCPGHWLEAETKEVQPSKQDLAQQFQKS